MNFFGEDIGRVIDSTVLVGFRYENGIAYQNVGKSWTNIPFQEQTFATEEILNVFPEFLMLIEENGLGRQMAEELQKKYAGVKAFTTTASTRELIFSNLKRWIDDKKVRLLPIQEQRNQVLSLTYQKTETIGKIVTSAENMHDDWAIAIALALWCIQKYEMSVMTEDRAKRLSEAMDRARKMKVI